MKTFIWHQLSLEERTSLLRRGQPEGNTRLKDQVREIIKQVSSDGDVALKRLTEQFDGIKLESFKVTSTEFEAAQALLPLEKQQAILQAGKNIQRFHEKQLPTPIYDQNPHHKCWREPRAIQRVGLYIPGGSAPLVSTVLMLAIPAAVAGCENRIMVTPPQKDGKIAPAILFAAQQFGIQDIYKVGGAQAIAALAYGTASIPKVDKIFGPGNKYVTEAKQQVSQDPLGAALDMPAGPSEVMVIADGRANPEFVASDLLAQAEHDPSSQAVLLTPNENLLAAVKLALENQLPRLSRAAIAEKALENSFAILTKSLEESFEIANSYAPEHLILQVENPEQYTSLVQNAGSVFLGAWTPEAVGDYASGTNHVLPTYGYARAYSGLGVEAFMKTISFQALSEEGLKQLGPVVESLAELEGLDGHKNSVTLRLAALEDAQRTVSKRGIHG